MTGTELSLWTLRRALAALGESDGRYRVVCATCGTRPVPVDTLRFPDRESATTAARLATFYRGRLRRYDPRTRRHDLTVRESPPDPSAALEPDRPAMDRNH